MLHQSNLNPNQNPNRPEQDKRKSDKRTPNLRPNKVEQGRNKPIDNPRKIQK